jgi:hypothetical protein
MRRSVLARLLSAAFVVLMLGGGGDMPILDGFFFHGRGSTPDAARPHVEASGGCHAERCSIHATAQPSRFAPTIGTLGLVLAEPRVAVRPAGKAQPPALPATWPSSRAPPVSSRV